MENCSFWIFNHICACKEIIGGEKQKNKSPENVCDLKQAINTQSWTSLILSNKRKKYSKPRKCLKTKHKLGNADYISEMEENT